MARIRSIKPEFWNDRKLARLSRDARLLYVALWNYSDEHGRLHGDSRYVKGHCLPYDDDLSLSDVDGLLSELEQAGRVQRYEHDGDPYLFLPTLSKHQRLESAKQPSRLPKPTTLSVDAEKSAESADKSAESPDEPGEIVAQQVAGSRVQVAGSRGGESATPSLSAVADEPRQDVEGLCSYFVAALARNDVKANVTAKWRTEARLMLDRDERPSAEIRAIIDWATRDSFWKGNILSLPKFREKYDQLRLQMHKANPVVSVHPHREHLAQW